GRALRERRGAARGARPGRRLRARSPRAAADRAGLARSMIGAATVLAIGAAPVPAIGMAPVLAIAAAAVLAIGAAPAAPTIEAARAAQASGRPEPQAEYFAPR